MSGRRIALLTETDAPRGAEGVIYRLALDLRAREYEVFPVILPHGEGWLSGRLADDGFAVHMPTLNRPVDPRFARELAAWCGHMRIDVLHAHEFTFGFYAGVAGLLSKVPHLFTMHGGVTFAHAARRRWALRWSAKRAAAVVGVSEATCQHLSQSLSIPRSRIDLVLNGVAPVASKRGREVMRSALGLPRDEHVFVSVGSLHPVKGHAVLIAACGILAGRIGLPPWRLLVAGRGEEQLALEAQIHALGLADRVTLLGLRDDVADVLGASDSWVMPSLSEGLPLALLEGMLAKLPIVSSAVGGIPDLIRDGDTGLLVPPSNPERLADAMARILAEPALAHLMATNAFALANSEFTAARMVDRYERLYDRALGSRSAQLSLDAA